MFIVNRRSRLGTSSKGRKDQERQTAKPESAIIEQNTTKKAQTNSADPHSIIAQQEKQLQMTLSQLKRINQTKDELLTKIGHELLTPINGIMGSLELALRSYESTQQMQLIKTALDSSHKLHHVIRDIIDLGQLSRGELKLEKGCFNFGDILTELLESSEREAKDKGLSWHQIVNLDKEVELNGDGFRLAQVLRNLIDNAIKFTETGSITASFKGNLENRRLFLFEATIEDTGIGIEKVEQRNIFQTFYQVETFCDREHQGSGVGLSLVYLLVKQMGGQISVQSTPGKGSRFSLKIPLTITRTHEHNQQQIEWGKRSSTRHQKTQLSAVGSSEQLLKEKVIEKDSAITPLDTPKSNTNDAAKKREKGSAKEDTPLLLEGHILIVEDNGVNQMILKGLLSKIGLTADVAGNGKIALEKLLANDYQLVLMDCQMPVMDGLTASKQIRKLKNSRQNIPIIAITANVTEKDKQSCFDAGMNDFLNKPINPDLLYPAVMKWLHYWERIRAQQ